VREARRFVSERAREQDLPRRAVEVFVALQDEIDAHRRVVDGRSEDVRGAAVRLAHGKIRHRVVLEHDVALDEVVNDGGPGRHANPRRAVPLVRGAARQHPFDMPAYKAVRSDCR